MKILITGVSGLVGQELVLELMKEGHDDFVFLTRNKESFLEKFALPGEVYEWNPHEGKIDSNCLNGVEVVINLAGENISTGRWTDSKKKAMYNSRVLGTRCLVDLANEKGHDLKVFINASAIGIYGDSDNQTFTESSELGTDYLASLCRSWEDELKNLKKDIRQLTVRTGVVLSLKGGALEKMLPPFLMGLGGPIGSGKQMMSWIHVNDLARIFIFLMNNEKASGPFNAVAPQSVSNKKFSKALGKTIRRPVLFPVPTFVLKVIFGEMSVILTSGQIIVPEKLTELGFKFNFPAVDKAFEQILESLNFGLHEFEQAQWIDRSLDEVFPFFSDDKNLEKITPDSLNFKVLKKSTEKIEKGTQIDYQLKLHGIPLKWISKITAWEENNYFIDEQLKGPYNKWIHRHEFSETKSGTLMIDKVQYQAPFGPIGKLTNLLWIKKDIQKIFKYRKDHLNEFLK